MKSFGSAVTDGGLSRSSVDDKTDRLLTLRGRLGGPIELAVPLSSSDVSSIVLTFPLLYLDLSYSPLNMYLHPVSL